MEQTDGTLNKTINVDNYTDLKNALENEQDATINLNCGLTMAGETLYVKNGNILRITTGHIINIKENAGFVIESDSQIINYGVLNNYGKLTVEADAMLVDMSTGYNDVVLNNLGIIDVYGTYVNHYGGETYIISDDNRNNAIITLDDSGTATESHVEYKFVTDNIVYTLYGKATIDDGGNGFLTGGNKLVIAEGSEATVEKLNIVATSYVYLGPAELENNGKITVTGTFTNNGITTNKGTIEVEAGATFDDKATGIGTTTVNNQGIIDVYGTYISHFGGETYLISDDDRSDAIITLDDNGSHVSCKRNTTSGNMEYTLYGKATVDDGGKRFLMGGDKLIINEDAKATIKEFTVDAITTGTVELVNNGKITVTGTFTNNGITTNNSTIEVEAGATFDDETTGIGTATVNNQGIIDVYGTYISHNDGETYLISDDAAIGAIMTLTDNESYVECKRNKTSGHMEYTLSGKAIVDDEGRRFLTGGDKLIINEDAEATIVKFTVDAIAAGTVELVNNGKITVTGILTNNSVTTNNSVIEVRAGATLEDMSTGTAGIVLNNRGIIMVYGTFLNHLVAKCLVSDDATKEAIITLVNGTNAESYIKSEFVDNDNVYTLFGNATIDDDDNRFLTGGDKLIINEDAEAIIVKFTVDAIATGTVELVNKGKIIITGGTLTNNGKIVNDGTIEVGWNNGKVANNSEIVNNNNMTCYGVIENDGALTNMGTIVNDKRGTFDNDGIFINRYATSTFTNDGTIDNDVAGTMTNQGTFTNNGTMRSAGDIANESKYFENKGVIANTGTITNNGAIVNSGAVNNESERGTFTNTGIVINCCASVPIQATKTLNLTVNDTSFGTITIDNIDLLKGRVTATANETEPHKFSHWSDAVIEDKNKTKVIDIEAGTISWAAIFIEGTVTVTFDPNGGTEPSIITKKLAPGMPYGELPTTERTGYDFAGWFTKAEGGELVTKDSTVPSNNHTLYAHWTAIDVTVTFDSNGGDPPSFATKTVKFDSEYGELPTTKKAESAFIGWFTDAIGGNLITAESIVAISENHTLYAHWDMGIITVTFDSNGPEISVPEKTVRIGGTYGTLPTVEWEYFDFVGWYTAKIGGEKITESTVVTVKEDQTLYAIWSKTKETVNDDGSKTKTDSRETEDPSGNKIVTVMEETTATDGTVTKTKSVSTISGNSVHTVSFVNVTDGSGNIVSTTESVTETNTMGIVTFSYTTSTTTKASGDTISVTEEVTITEIDKNVKEITTVTKIDDGSGIKKIYDTSVVTQLTSMKTSVESTTVVKDKNDNVISTTVSNMTTTAKIGDRGETEGGSIIYKDSNGKVIMIEEIQRDTSRGVSNGTTTISVEETIVTKNADGNPIYDTRTESLTTVVDGGETTVKTVSTVSYPDGSKRTVESLKVTDKDCKMTSTAYKITGKSSETHNFVITTYNDVKTSESGAAIITADAIREALNHSKYVSNMMKMPIDVERIINFNSEGEAHATANSDAFLAIKSNGVGIAATGSDGLIVMLSSETLKSITGGNLDIHAFLDDAITLSLKQKEIIGDRSFVTVESSSVYEAIADGEIIVGYQLNADEIAKLSSASNMRIVPAMVLTDGTVVKDGLTADVDLKTGIVMITSTVGDVSKNVAFFVYIEHENPSSEPSNNLGFAFAVFAIVIVLLAGIAGYAIRRKP